MLAEINTLPLSPSLSSFSQHRRRRPLATSVYYGDQKDTKTTHQLKKTPTDLLKSTPIARPGNHVVLEPELSTKPQKIQNEGNKIGGVVALGKFDALHLGHRELAIQASKAGFPYLLSFVGMAEVFGWEPRAPIVAKCDRHRVLSSWSPYCGDVAPVEYEIEFSSVRHLSPRQFVEKLSKELGVFGVVAGENYRFGYNAVGDAFELVRLCEEFGMRAYIINTVMDKNQDSRNMNSNDLKEIGQVSSTSVRNALALGDMKYVSELLGRKHRLLLRLEDQERFSVIRGKLKVSAPKSYLLNLPPKEGTYDHCTLIIGNQNPLTCRVFIDPTSIQLETVEIGLCNYINFEDLKLLAVEFGG